jgi:hypothetical protein
MFATGDDIIEKRQIIERWMSLEIRAASVDFTYVAIVRGRKFSFSTRGHKTSNEAIIEAYRIARDEVRSVVKIIETDKRL